MKDIEWFANARHASQRRKADIALRARNEQPLHDESAINAGQWHHVADRGERHKIKQGKQIRPRSFATLPQDFGHLHQRQKDNARRAKVPLQRNIVFPVRIDNRLRIFGQITADLMVIEHDDISASLLCCRDRRCAVGAAINCDDQGCTLGDQITHGIGIRTVTFKNPVGDIDRMLNAVML